MADIRACSATDTISKRSVAVRGSDHGIALRRPCAPGAAKWHGYTGNKCNQQAVTQWLHCPADSHNATGIVSHFSIFSTLHSHRRFFSLPAPLVRCQVNLQVLDFRLQCLHALLHLLYHLLHHLDSPESLKVRFASKLAKSSSLSLQMMWSLIDARSQFRSCHSVEVDNWHKV